MIKLLLYVPKMILLGIYKALSYGGNKELTQLMIILTLILIRGFQKDQNYFDLIIIIVFFKFIWEFNKLSKENLYINDKDFTKNLLLKILRRQKQIEKGLVVPDDIRVEEVEKKPKKENKEIIKIYEGSYKQLKEDKLK